MRFPFGPIAEHVIVEQTIVENVVEAAPAASCVRNIR